MFKKSILLTAIPELSLGIFLVFSSSIGQTFFISLFSGEIRNEFNLSHGMFGIFYSTATLVSAMVFFWLGKITDKFNLTPLGLITLVAISGCSFLISSAESLLILFLSLLGLRLFGQSMLSHIAVTSIARWFSKKKRQSFEHCFIRASYRRGLVTLYRYFFFITTNLA